MPCRNAWSFSCILTELIKAFAINLRSSYLLFYLSVYQITLHIIKNNGKKILQNTVLLMHKNDITTDLYWAINSEIQFPPLILQEGTYF